jgi:hypothetical protein
MTKYYVITLQDYATPAWCTFEKDYVGSKDDILEFINAYRNEVGTDKLKQLDVLRKTKYTADNFEFSFKNVWDRTYDVVCDNVKADVLYAKEFRCVKAEFKNVRMRAKGMGDVYMAIGGLMWGHPGVLYMKDGSVASRLYFIEDVIDESIPIDFSQFMLDVVGDG